LELENLTEVAIAAAQKLGTDYAVALAIENKERLLRFANNSVTVANQVEETELVVYLSQEKRSAIASTSNPENAAVRVFVGELFDSLKGLPESDLAPLPARAAKYRPTAGSYDERIVKAGEALPELARTAIGAANSAGGKRSAGIINASAVRYSILATNGTRGSDARAEITLNIRSFSDGDASGQGLSCAASMSDFHPEEAGRRAGEDAKKMVGATLPEAGEYDVLLSPTVASNLIEQVAGAASAFDVESGSSCLAEKLGKKVASNKFNLTDHGTMRGALGGRSFDDEGMATGTTPLIKDGVLLTYLHNLSTARRWKATTTGNAGIIDPHAWNIEVGAGDASFDEIVKEMKKGMILTSNWYTRFKNRRTGEFSTVPRDGAFLVEGGNVTKPVRGMRLSDDLLRMFSSLKLSSKDREWIEWWEVDTPTLCPWLLIEGSNITRAFE
jgi:PmbA protein